MVHVFLFLDGKYKVHKNFEINKKIFEISSETGLLKLC